MNDAQKKAVLKSLEDKLSVLHAADLLWVSEKIGFDSQNENGDTLLHLAAFKGLEGVCKSLISAGSDANLLNNKGQVAADIALESGNLELALILRSSEDAGLSRQVMHQFSNVGLPEDLNRGKFVPTASTRLLDDAPSWEIPNELKVQRKERSIICPSAKPNIFPAEINKISQYLQREEISSENCIVAIYTRFSDILRVLRLTNPINDSSYNLDAVFNLDEDELLGLVDDFFNPGDVADYVIARAYTLEQELGAVRSRQAENLRKVLRGAESIGSICASEQLLDEALNLLDSDTVVEGLREVVWKIKDFANYLDKQNSEYDYIARKEIAEYLRSSLNFQRLVSGMCDLVPEYTLSDPNLNLEEVDSNLQHWLQPTIKIQISQDLRDLAVEAFSEVQVGTNGWDVFKSLGLDERLWSFEGS